MTAKKSPSKKTAAAPVATPASPWPEERPADAEEIELRLQHLDYAAECRWTALHADPTGNLCKMFGTYIEAEGLALRGSFVIDPDGVLQAYEIHNLPVGRSMQELLRKLKASKFVHENGGEVCPANWHPGKKTLKPGLDLVGKI